jgi:outer membrane immunogenic protein
MRLVRNIVVLALLGSLPAAQTARAADMISYETSTAKSVPLAPPTVTSSWNGFYAGIYGVAQNSSAGGTQYGAGVAAGINVNFDFYLVGAEVAVQGLTGASGNTTYGQVLGKAGLLATDNTMLYAAGGYGMDLGAGNQSDFLLGGGVEMSVTDNVSVRAQYLHGFPNTGANPKDQVSVGANFHF